MDPSERNSLSRWGQPHRHRIRRNSEGEVICRKTNPFAGSLLLARASSVQVGPHSSLPTALTVVATDVAPGAEAALKRFVAAAWPALQRLGLAAPALPQNRLSFTAALTDAVKDVESSPGRRTREDRFQEDTLSSAGRTAASRVIIASSSSGFDHERDPVGVRNAIPNAA